MECVIRRGWPPSEGRGVRCEHRASSPRRQAGGRSTLQAAAAAAAAGAAGMLVRRCTTLCTPTARACGRLRRLPASPAALHNIGSSCRHGQEGCSAPLAGRGDHTYLAAGRQQRFGHVRGRRADSLRHMGGFGALLLHCARFQEPAAGVSLAAVRLHLPPGPINAWHGRSGRRHRACATNQAVCIAVRIEHADGRG